MMKMNKDSSLKRLDFLFLACFFVGLLISLSINAGGSLIKVYFSDLLIPFLFLLFFIFHIKQLDGFSLFLPLQIVVLLVIIFAWFTVSLNLGYQSIGHLQKWAFFNKYIGLVVVFCYFLTFSMVGFHLSKATVDQLFLVGLFFAVVTVLFSLKNFFAVAFGAEFYSRFLGFSGNPNSYGFVLAMVYICAISAISALKADQNFKQTLVLILLSSLVFFGIIFTASKSTWLALMPTVLILAFFEKKARWLLFYSILIGLCLSVIILILWDYIIYDSHQTYLLKLESEQFDLSSDSSNSASHRGEQYHRAFLMWLTRPFEGVGLGVFLNTEQFSNRHHIIHSTPLWLLTETGIVGLFLFIVLGIFLLVRCLLLMKYEKHRNWGVLGFCCLNFMVIFSIPTEALYQRYIWVIMGLITGKSYALQINFNISESGKFKNTE